MIEGLLFSRAAWKAAGLVGLSISRANQNSEIRIRIENRHITGWFFCPVPRAPGYAPTFWKKRMMLSIPR